MRVVHDAGGWLLAIGLAALSGCAVGPDFDRPAAPDVEGFTSSPLPGKTVSTEVAGGEAQRINRPMEPSGPWRRFDRNGPISPRPAAHRG